MPGIPARRLVALTSHARGVGPEAQNARRVLRKHGYRPPARTMGTPTRIRSTSMGANAGAPGRGMARMGNTLPVRRGSNLPALRSTRDPIAAARTGKGISRVVAGGIVGAGIVGMYTNRSGRAADRPMGRPTGVYGY